MAESSRSSSLTPCNSPSPEPPIVQPDHFYGSEGIQLPPSPNSDGKTWLDPDDDPTASRGIPVFKPTMDEFQDFERYMERVNCWGMKSGIVKVIPPKEWSASLPDIKPQLREVKIRSPIEQVMLGSGGLFRQQNMEKRRIMSVREWAELCAKDEYRAPVKQAIGLESRGERAAMGRNRRVKKKPSVAPTPEAVVNEEVEEAGASPSGSTCPPSVPSPPASESGLPAEATPRKPSASPKKEASAEAKVKGKRVHQSREARQASLAERAARDSQFIDSFDPHKDWLPSDMEATDYSPEFCAKLERHYWRTCGLGISAWYGADTQGTLYTDKTKVWNVGKLPSALSRLLPTSDAGLPGVNTPYLYFGMWRATFAWHVEDMDLYSINYIHFGAPKFWYAVPQAKAHNLESAMRTYFPKDTSQCPQFLRHKSFLASPSTLAKSSCRPNHLVQHAGEFVITYPRGYHAGFNLGFNCAESVNFALECWIEMGRVAKVCKCVSDSVTTDVDQLLHDRAEEACQSASSSSKGSPKRTKTRDPAPEEVIPPLRIPLKRKVEEKLEERPAIKKIRLPASPAKLVLPAVVIPPLTLPPPQNKPPPPKLSVKLKLGPKPVEETYPCCLCISTDRTGLLRVRNPPVKRKDAVEAAGNPSVWMAHGQCASILPETWVDEVVHPDGFREKVVHGVDAIVKDRWNLKCSACTKTRPKAHGAPVQCTKGKCPKAFHVSCAREGYQFGLVFSIVRQVEKEVVLVDAHSPPTDYGPVGMQLDAPVDGNAQVVKTVKKMEVLILCPQHNPELAAQKRASKQEKIKNDLLALPTMSRIKIRVSSGVFEVSLIRVIEESGSVEVLWDRGTRKEFKWGSVMFGSTDGPVQQKPADAQVHLSKENERSVSILPSVAVPVQTYPSLTAATSSANVSRVSTPTIASVNNAAYATMAVTQPATTSQAGAGLGPGSRNPYWSYAPQQMQYAVSQTQYTYPYTGYYQAAAYAGTSQQAYATYPYPHTYQWRHSDPSNSTNPNSTNPNSGHQVASSSQHPPQASTSHYRTTTKAQTVAPGQVVAATPSLSASHSQSSDSSQTTTQSASDGTSGMGLTTPQVPSTSLTEMTAPVEQQGLPDLLALARMRPQELTEVLRANPQLREYVMAAIQQSSVPQPNGSSEPGAQVSA